MLRLMLDSHPDLAIPGESHFIPGLWRERTRFRANGGVDARRLASEAMRRSQFRRWGVPEAAVWRRIEALETPTFGEVVAALFLAYADEHGKPRWGDKTPPYVRSIPLLARLFPGSRFVHIIRDGRDVAMSFLSFSWGPSTIWSVASKWATDVRAGRSGGAEVGPGRYLEIRYEQLVAAPRHVLAEVCAFAALPFDERMLAYHQDAAGRLQARPERARQHLAATAPPTAGLRDWRSQMDARDVRAFEAVAGDTLSDLGYARRYPTISIGRRAEAFARVGVETLETRIRGRLGLDPWRQRRRTNDAAPDAALSPSSEAAID